MEYYSRYGTHLQKHTTLRKTTSAIQMNKGGMNPPNRIGEEIYRGK